MEEQELNKLVGHLFRHEAGRMAAVLTRLLGFNAFDLAEDIVQDSLLQAMSVWRYKGIPENPSAWLYTVARRRALDSLRQKKTHDHHHGRIRAALQSEWTLSTTVNRMFRETEIEDSQLRMIFACCHPSIPYDSQIALTLKALCGLSVREIAHSFLTREETIAKRIYRAREKIREEKVELDLPPPATIPGRLDAVLHTLYLLFNEGYNATAGEQLIRDDLCEEAMRLMLLLTNNPVTATPASCALLSLMCFQASRSEARVDKEGGIILLRDQDRLKWNADLIEKGKYFLEIAGDGAPVTEYHLEAAIAGCHADAASFEATDWSTILKLYEILSRIRPDPIIEMNKAIALGYTSSIQEGLDALKKINQLENHHLYHATVGDFCLILGDHASAQQSYHKALALCTSGPDRKLLEKKLKKVKHAAPET
jgi:RNA polymerase sigma-70 factor (ECF subfamily)